jgi:hypothetical protein
VLLLHSTRADVEKLFGKPSSGQGYLVGYKLNINARRCRKAVW